MTGSTRAKYECNLCQKPYVKKGCLTKHLKNVHNVNDLDAEKEFLDSTSYSELDRDETILRTVGQILTADSFYQDLSTEEELFDEPRDTSQDPRNTTTLVNNQEVLHDLNTSEPLSTSSTAAPVPLCSKAEDFILQKGKTLPATLLASLLPAPGFLEELNKSIQAQDESLEVTKLLTTFDEEIRSHMCEICGTTHTGKVTLRKHMVEHVQEAPNLSPISEPPFDMPSLGDYLAGMKDNMDRQTVIMSQQSEKMDQQFEIISQQSVMIEKLLTIQQAKIPENVTTNRRINIDNSDIFSKCNLCSFEANSNTKLDEHSRAKHSTQPELVKCPMCNFTTSSSTEIIKHVENQHPERFECDFCRKHFKCKTELGKHKTESHNSPNKEVYMTGLLIGDSHIKSVSNRILERACKGENLRNPARTKPSEGSAYTTTKYTAKAKYPESNLEDRVPDLLREKSYDYMITLTPSNNITNMKDIENHTQYQLAEETATETLGVVEKALKDSNTLKDVMIVELPPRVDSKKLQHLTEYSNFVLREAVRKSSLNHRITIASLDSLWDYSEQEIYGHPDSSRYDGIHMRGKQGSKAYTRCIEEAVRSSRFSNTSSSTSSVPTTYSSIPTSNRYQVLSN